MKQKEIQSLIIRKSQFEAILDAFSDVRYSVLVNYRIFISGGARICQNHGRDYEEYRNVPVQDRHLSIDEYEDISNVFISAAVQGSRYFDFIGIGKSR